VSEATTKRNDGVNKYRCLEVGDPVPGFVQRSTSNPGYTFDTAAGRYIVMCFFATGADEQGRLMLRILDEHRPVFDDDRVAFFGVSLDPADEREGRVCGSVPGIRYFWDFDGTVSRLYGAIPVDARGGRVGARRFWLVLDPTLRVRAVFPARPDAGERHEVAAYLKALPPVDAFSGFPVQAPILVLPNVFEPDLCRHLVELYRARGGKDSGFMREVDGKTVGVVDYGHKRRSDCSIEDGELKAVLQRTVRRRVLPEIRKAYQFEATRMERYIVACYDGETRGHFCAHRDNTTKGTAHRKFALSINLNDDFDGGEVGFPEYGSRTFKAPMGGAVVFSCSLLHAVSPVTRGRRYVFLPFLYDEAAAALREANNPYLDSRVGAYRKED
jgi:predicted 2-oxoglutarate/Fe(II)-dependent dioxygenase YbiX/peroxiredoxin